MFCRFCGNELHNEAYVCPSCGRLVKPLPTEYSDEQMQPCPQPIQPSRKFYRLAKIFSILGTVFSGLTLLFGVIFLSMIVFGVTLMGDAGIILVLYSLFALLAMVGFAPFALTMGILAFVFSRKSPEATGGFPVFTFIFSIVAFVIGWGTYFSLLIQ